VGIDHSFSVPLRHFEVHHLEPDCPSFLDDFQRHWPTDADHTHVNFVRDGLVGNGAARWGSARWRRFTPKSAAGAKPVLNNHDRAGQGLQKELPASLPAEGIAPAQENFLCFLEKCRYA
jgi:hypothetical protein